MTDNTLESSWHEVDLPLDRLVTEGKVSGCIVALPENEHPPLRWAGLIDWRTHGLISQSIKEGIFRGSIGECGYLLWNHHHNTIHILTVGLGEISSLGSRGHIPQHSTQALIKNLKSMGQVSWALSSAEFSQETCNTILQNIPKGGRLWVTT